jgi:hypothetical protein
MTLKGSVDTGTLHCHAELQVFTAVLLSSGTLRCVIG